MSTFTMEDYNEVKPSDEVVERRKVFIEGARMIDDIVTRHGLKEYRMGAPAFSSGSTVTPAEQHVDLILRVANWLLQEDS